ncbi:MAG: aspartyl protease family protein [Candidatus Lambdaproteobacteria bacterium]|nr:aspartyl protease family protein [Candidatus Lambdaproteobacteria bacterium]
MAEGQPLTTSTFYNALLDTGATSTCISPRVVQEVGPKPTGKAQMIGATGVEAKNTYHFGVGFLLNPVQQPSGLMAGNLSVMELDGMEFSYEGTGFDVLLGRDVLCKGAFSLSFDGHFILSF